MNKPCSSCPGITRDSCDQGGASGDKQYWYSRSCPDYREWQGYKKGKHELYYDILSKLIDMRQSVDVAQTFRKSLGIRRSPLLGGYRKCVVELSKWMKEIK
jgi:hypothetical protein